MDSLDYCAEIQRVQELYPRNFGQLKHAYNANIDRLSAKRAIFLSVKQYTVSPPKILCWIFMFFPTLWEMSYANYEGQKSQYEQVLTVV